ncbi:Afadin and alpha-actinin-binding-domain-containing protein [Amanita rubescens]|nr:Afadin and alpha-actinin-binding-domain-containing protein [Amanita rubescens]
MATPKKFVHWGTNNSFSDTADSLSFASTSSDTCSSALEYVNAQLVAHGFAPSPGLSLDGISNANAERVSKCLLDLLGQRTNDMARTEDLTTKLRVLQYDYERLQSMHRTAQSDAENAERETNLQKARLATVTKTLQTAENAHKQTSAELQRTRSTLQSIRTAHQTELKKKEREFERMIEKWSKVAEVQSKLTTVPSGITCANAEIVEGTERLGESQRFLEVALEQAEQARGQLLTESVRLKKLVLRTVNQLYGLMYRVHNPGSDEEPPELTLDNIFPLNPPDAAEQRVIMAINDFEDMVLSDPPPKQLSSPELQINSHQEAEIVRLRDTIGSLRREIKRLQEDSSAQLREAQSQFDEYAKKHEKLMVDTKYVNAQEKEKLDQIMRGIDEEKRALEDEVQKLNEKQTAFEAEKSSWQTQRMPIDKNSVPVPAIVPPPLAQSSQGTRTTQRRVSQRIAKQPQGKSPIKSFKVGKSNRRKAVTAAQIRESLSSPKAKKLTPSYETEVVPIPVPTITLSGAQGGGAGKLDLNPTKANFLLASSFVLPPPSPEASLPRHPMDLGQPIPPPQFLALPNSTPSHLPKLPDFQDFETSDVFSSHTPIESLPDMDDEQEIDPYPRRNFPVAKPLARRMVHAYSPVKPSPLSRVIVAGSPGSPDVPVAQYRGSALIPLREEEDLMLEQKYEPFPPTVERDDEEMTLAQQLGIPDSPPESSALKRKRVDSSGSSEGSRRRHRSSVRMSQNDGKTTSKGRVLIRNSHAISTAKGKGKDVSSSRSGGLERVSTHRRSTKNTSTSQTGASSSKAAECNNASQTEKENKRDESGKRKSTAKLKASSSSKLKTSTVAETKGDAMKQSTSESSQAPMTNAMSTRTRLLAKLPPSSRGVSGPRRILVESSERTDKRN